MRVALDLVRKGTRNGEMIDIWRYNWIPRYYHLKPFTLNMMLLDDTTVASCGKKERISWDES